MEVDLTLHRIVELEEIYNGDVVKRRLRRGAVRWPAIESTVSVGLRVEIGEECVFNNFTEG